MNVKTSITGAAHAVLLAASGHAWSAEVEVKALNKGSQGAMMVFEPAFVWIAPGMTLNAEWRLRRLRRDVSST